MNEEMRRDTLLQLMHMSPMLWKRLIKPMSMQCGGLPLSQVKVLFFLTERHELTMGKLAEELFVSNQQMTKIVDGLVHKGYAERFSNPDNRREVIVHATDAGKAYIDGLKKEKLQLMLKEFEKISDEDIAALREYVEKIEEIIQKL